MCSGFLKLDLVLLLESVELRIKDAVEWTWNVVLNLIVVVLKVN